MVAASSKSRYGGETPRRQLAAAARIMAGVITTSGSAIKAFRRSGRLRRKSQAEPKHSIPSR